MPCANVIDAGIFVRTISSIAMSLCRLTYSTTSGFCCAETKAVANNSSMADSLFIYAEISEVLK
jgi:hypothetical protein